MVKCQSNWITAWDAVIISLWQQTLFEAGPPTSTAGRGSPRPLPAHAPGGGWQKDISGLTGIKAMFRTNFICITFLWTTSQIAYLTSFGIPQNIPKDLPFPWVFTIPSSSLCSPLGCLSCGQEQLRAGTQLCVQGRSSQARGGKAPGPCCASPCLCWGGEAHCPAWGCCVKSTNTQTQILCTAPWSSDQFCQKFSSGADGQCRVFRNGKYHFCWAEECCSKWRTQYFHGYHLILTKPSVSKVPCLRSTPVPVPEHRYREVAEPDMGCLLLPDVHQQWLLGERAAGGAELPPLPRYPEQLSTPSVSSSWIWTPFWERPY